VREKIKENMTAIKKWYVANPTSGSALSAVAMSPPRRDARANFTDTILLERIFNRSNLAIYFPYMTPHANQLKISTRNEMK
jgi:hypothetical protein